MDGRILYVLRGVRCVLRALAERYTRLTQNQFSLGSNPKLPTIKNYLTFEKIYGIIYMLKKYGDIV